MIQIPFFDLKRQYEILREDLLAEIAQVCDLQQFILGSRVEAFEKALSDQLSGNFTLGTSSGTDAQLLILMALGVGRGDGIITTPFTFFSTAGCIARLGATPLFVDIESRTFNLSPERLETFLLEECEQKQDGLHTKGGLRVKAVIPVHLFGLCCAMQEILSLSSRFGLPVIEDAAQAIGAKYPLWDSTTSAGCEGDFAFSSFYPTKNLGAFGDAGLAVTRHQAIFQKMVALRNHGIEKKYQHQYLGGNFRLDELQAAVLLKKLPFLPQWSRRRWEIAQRYRSNLEDLDPEICLPSEPFVEKLGSEGHSYHQYVIRTARRDELRNYLGNQGIGTEIYYPVPLHHQECFRFFLKQHLSEAERAASEVIALPVFPELTDEEVDIVSERIGRFFKR